MALVNILITILILGLVFGLIWWVLDQIALPAPFKLAAQVVLGIIMVILLLSMLFGGVNVPWRIG